MSTTSRIPCHIHIVRMVPAVSALTLWGRYAGICILSLSDHIGLSFITYNLGVPYSSYQPNSKNAHLPTVILLDNNR